MENLRVNFSNQAYNPTPQLSKNVKKNKRINSC